MNFSRFSVLLLAAACAVPAPPQDAPSSPFAQLDEIVKELSRITGWPLLRKVNYESMSRGQLKAYFEKRIREVVKPEEIRVEELTLKKFGFVPAGYNLEEATIELLTEQAAAFYDYRAKKMVLLEDSASGLQQIALVHELAHALADQHVNLEKFIDKAGKSDDGALARAAVMEGQATWLMAEYMANRMGQSLKDAPWMLDMMSKTAAAMGDGFPVFNKAPLYIRETLVFPYAQGLRFHQEMFMKLGPKCFAELFKRPPLTTREILHPEHYLGRAPLPPVRLPSFGGESGYRKIAEGTLGEFDHAILLRQYAADSEPLAAAWRGGSYRIFEHKNNGRLVLVYASRWETPRAASDFFRAYRKVLAGKWANLQPASESDAIFAGAGDDGHFLVRLDGDSFLSIEGLDRPAAGGNSAKLTL